MSTVIRSELSKDNPYYISKHRFLELKHFCLQLDEWKEVYLSLNPYTNDKKTQDYKDSTSNDAVILEECSRNMDLIKKIADESDPYLSEYIFKAVTKGVSYTYLRTVLDMPCGKDMFYDRFRRFFWLLDKSR